MHTTCTTQDDECAKRIPLVPLKSSGKTVSSSQHRDKCRPLNNDQKLASMYDYFETAITPNLQKPKCASSNTSPCTDDEGNNIKQGCAETDDSDSDSDLTHDNENDIKDDVSLASHESTPFSNSVEVINDEADEDYFDRDTVASKDESTDKTDIMEHDGTTIEDESSDKTDTMEHNGTTLEDQPLYKDRKGSCYPRTTTHLRKCPLTTLYQMTTLIVPYHQLSITCCRLMKPTRIMLIRQMTKIQNITITSSTHHNSSQMI